MTISIVIPYFKNAQHIKRSLKSVFEQTYQNFKIIIINDYSPDWEEALPIINSFSDARIKTISHTSNKNGAAARNTGIKSAKGAYIAFLDADDEWLPNHLNNLIVSQEKENAEVTYTTCTVKSKNNFSYTVPKKSIGLSNNLGEYLFCDDGFMQTSCLLVKTATAQNVLFNESLRRHQEYDFLLKLEDANAKFSWSPVSTVIVHWENNDIRNKGGTWDFSLQFVIDYKKYFTPKAFSRFILQFVVLPNIEEKNNFRALSLIVKYINPFHLSKLNYYFILSYFLFGEFKHPYKRKQ